MAYLTNVGGVKGQMACAAMTFLIEMGRELAKAGIYRLPDVVREAAERITIGEIFSMDPEKVRVARTVVEFPEVAYPEEFLEKWQLEFVQITSDSNPRNNPGIREIEGTVLFRETPKKVKRRKGEDEGKTLTVLVTISSTIFGNGAIKHHYPRVIYGGSTIDPRVIEMMRVQHPDKFPPKYPDVQREGPRRYYRGRPIDGDLS